MISADTIKEIAISIEEKGIEFYKKLREYHDNSSINEIIEEEEKHIDLFNTLFDTGKGIVGDEKFSHSYMNRETFLAVYMDNDVFNKLDTSDLKEEDAINMAILMEKESILFF